MPISHEPHAVFSLSPTSGYKGEQKSGNVLVNITWGSEPLKACSEEVLQIGADPWHNAKMREGFMSGCDRSASPP